MGPDTQRRLSMVRPTQAEDEREEVFVLDSVDSDEDDDDDDFQPKAKGASQPLRAKKKAKTARTASQPLREFGGGGGGAGAGAGGTQTQKQQQQQQQQQRRPSSDGGEGGGGGAGAERPRASGLPRQLSQTQRGQQRQAAQPQQQRQRKQPEEPLQFTQQDIRSITNKIEMYKTERDNVAQSLNVEISDEDLNDLVGHVCRAVLFAHYDKPHVPIARTHLSEVIGKRWPNHKQKTKLPQLVIAYAQHKLLQVAGLEMKEVERPAGGAGDKGKKGAGGGGGGGLAGPKYYVLRSMLPAGVREAVLPPLHERRTPPPGLTMLVLAIVHLEGGKVSEEALREHVGALGVRLPEEAAAGRRGGGASGAGGAAAWPHTTLGDVKELFGRMEACRYLVRSKRANVAAAAAAAGGGGAGGEAQWVYEWGECAHEEIGEAGVKAFIEQEFAAPLPDQDHDQDQAADADSD